MKNKYIPTSAGLYLNYFVHGMGVILITLNMAHLQQQWGTDAAGVSMVISSLGIGRILVLLVSGALSDKFGRKPFVYLGMICYIIALIGIISSTSTSTAYAFGIMAGMANSFLDSGTYPALMECFPEAASTANVLLKAFISAGQFLLPFIISILIAMNVWFGWSFVVAIALLAINVLYMIKRPFPDSDNKKEEKAPTAAASTPARKESLLFEGVCFTLYGYISMATFYLVSQWLAQYGQFVAGMEYTSAIKLLSIYTTGSLCCVFVTAALTKKAVSPLTLLIAYTFISFVALLLVCLFPTPLVVMAFSFVIGYSAAGGVMQLALVIMAQRFAGGKGKTTGIFYTAGSIASFTIPLVTAHLSKISIASIMWFDMGIGAVGFLLALLIAYSTMRAKAANQQALKQSRA
jgi:MFS family permease